MINQSNNDKWYIVIIAIQRHYYIWQGRLETGLKHIWLAQVKGGSPQETHVCMAHEMLHGTDHVQPLTLQCKNGVEEI